MFLADDYVPKNRLSRGHAKLYKKVSNLLLVEVAPHGGGTWMENIPGTFTSPFANEFTALILFVCRESWSCSSCGAAAGDQRESRR